MHMIEVCVFFAAAFFLFWIFFFFCSFPVLAKPSKTVFSKQANTISTWKTKAMTTTTRNSLTTKRCLASRRCTPPLHRTRAFIAAPAATQPYGSSKSSSSGPRLKSEDFFTGDGSKAATERLIKDLQAIAEEDSDKFGYSVDTIDDNLYLWEARLFDFDGELAKDMKKRNVEFVKLEMRFPKDYVWKAASQLARLALLRVSASRLVRRLFVWSNRVLLFTLDMWPLAVKNSTDNQKPFCNQISL